MNGIDTYTQYDDKSIAIEYKSTFGAKQNYYLRFQFFYQKQTLGTTGITYHISVHDKRGLTYYLYNEGITEGSRPDIYQRGHIVAVQDQYGNMIRYQYGEEINSRPYIKKNN